MLKPDAQTRGGPMLAIGMIVTFLVVMAALNFIDFGRLD